MWNSPWVLPITSLFRVSTCIAGTQNPWLVAVRHAGTRSARYRQICGEVKKQESPDCGGCGEVESLVLGNTPSVFHYFNEEIGQIDGLL